MAKQEHRVGAQGISELIALLSARGASGRLKIVTGTTEGELLFNRGNLVDARFGHLTGFPAVNAIAAMPETDFEFDPSIETPTSSSINSTERVVLKQFFGIDAADSKHQPLSTDDADERTLVTTKAPPAPAEVLPLYRRRYRPRRPKVNYRVVFAVSVFLVALSLAAAAWLLKQEYREQNAKPAVAGKTESAPPPSVAVNTTAPANTTVAATTKINDKALPVNPDLTGKWNVVNTVHTTSYRSFKDMRIGFAVSINQNGKTFTAQGQKISENGRTLPAGDRTPIQVNGVIKGDRIEATFSEQGSARKTSGRFVWKIDRAGGLLTGTFASTAARASGKSTATRQL